jgi:hypothetical protein
MRAAHSTDKRGGNNYRYQREIKRKRDQEEYWARQRKSDEFYKKLGIGSKKLA